jgi:methylaspartate ammonia-lyase
MKIAGVLTAPATGAFFYDDQLAIREGASQDGFLYRGAPRTDGFTAIRMPARALSIGLVLEDDHVVWGDMMGVQYSAGAGRDPVFDPELAAALVRTRLAPRLIGHDVASFRNACTTALGEHAGDAIPRAVEYGLSQALLQAAAYAGRRTMAQVVCMEYRLPVPSQKVPLYAQCGDSRRVAVDKMILHSVDVLPHGLINSRDKFGDSGEAFLDYVKWITQRIRTIGASDYMPKLHFDVYGWVGLTHGLCAGKIATFIARAADAAAPFDLHIESPADFGSREGQLHGFCAIMAELERLGSAARIVADEWCNDLADIRAFIEARAAHILQIKMPDVGALPDAIAAAIECKAAGIGAYIGGSCVETDLSARASVHVAVATQADMLLAKPGMGVDEGLSIVRNEQNRLFAQLRERNSHPSALTRPPFRGAN